MSTLMFTPDRWLSFAVTSLFETVYTAHEMASSPDGDFDFDARSTSHTNAALSTTFGHPERHTTSRSHSTSCICLLTTDGQCAAQGTPARPHFMNASGGSFLIELNQFKHPNWSSG
jgi:hypothetical protein